MQEIKELTILKLDELFIEIQKMTQELTDKLLPSSEVLSRDLHQEIDQRVKEKWHEIKDGVEYLSHKLSRAEQSKVMQFTEDEFNKKRRKFNQSIDKKSYQIKLNPHTKRIVLPRKIESTETRLKQGKLHAQVIQELKQYWRDSFGYLEDPKYFWGNLCLSFIYVSGCADEQHLTTIQKQLQESIESDTDLNCFRLYHSSYKKITNPLLLHYRVENSQYGNDVEQNKLYQWKHVFLNPYAQLFLQHLKNLKAENKEYRLKISIQDCILESLNHMGRNKISGNLQYQIKRRGFRAFNDVQMVLEFNPNLSLDIFLSNVLQQEINTVALRPSEFRILWNSEHRQVMESSSSSIHFEQEQLQQHMTPTVHRKLQAIPYELMLFDQKKRKSKKVEHLDKKRNKEERTLRYWQETKSVLEGMICDSNTEENLLIDAQLRLIHWLLHLRNRGLQLSTIESYLGSFGKEFIFEIWLNKLDLNQQSIDDYEDLYRQLLKYSSERDEQAIKRDLVKGKISHKMHQTAEYRFGRLKDFHQFCIENYDAPEVLVLKNANFKHLQICNARLVSPLLFSKLIEKLERLSQEPKALEWSDHLSCLKLMYLLSYRTGLRLNEVRCLKVQDIICPELLYKDDKNAIFNNITLHVRDNSYRRLKTQSANRQIPLKIALSSHEFLIVQQYIQQRYQQYLVNEQDDLLFSVDHRVLTDQCISKITVDLFNQILGMHHGFSFHTLRHSAANYLAITLLGSKEMIKTYTDYSWVKAKKMRALLFGVKACDNEEVIQHKWQVLAAWMGHSSIEQTASNYLHVLDLLAVDRIYNSPCMISKKVLQSYFGRLDSDTEQVDLTRYTQQQKWFSTELKIQTASMTSQREKKFSIAERNLTPYQRLISVREGRLRKDIQAQEWMQRCLLMTAKWMDPKNFNLNPNNVNSKKIDIDWFDELHEKAKKLTRSGEITSFLDLHYLDDKEKKTPKDDNMINAFKALLFFGKLRKNFLYFQCRKKNDEQQVIYFINGIEPMLESHLYLDKQNYPINIEEPERTVKFSFQRVVESNKKNVTPLVLFNLMLKIMEEDELFNSIA
ncbi:tyrosine-type recombinase/integrase [Acinetobacter pollinis]|uniref:Site-specific integrase n=1 Tax=Acinetobacter pollinis TaxID=2605270 RepID=A0ABU6DVX2_9GAMM|nr:tyrosine-type recombinase/integrase [Acinetobacter pollinis]MEB5477548.1 site-specific integrase [Acinetobacter pollinis]